MYMGKEYLSRMLFKEKIVDEVKYEFVKNKIDKSMFAIAARALNSSRTEYTIPESIDGCPVYVVDDLAFCVSSNLESVTLPSTIIQIGRGAFRGCKKLKRVNIPEGVEVIMYETFYGCDSLRNIDLTNVRSIERDAFLGCGSLRNVKLNENVLIAGGAFRNTPAEKIYNL